MSVYVLISRDIYYVYYLQCTLFYISMYVYICIKINSKFMYNTHEDKSTPDNGNGTAADLSLEFLFGVFVLICIRVCTASLTFYNNNLYMLLRFHYNFCTYKCKYLIYICICMRLCRWNFLFATLRSNYFLRVFGHFAYPQWFVTFLLHTKLFYKNTYVYVCVCQYFLIK